MINTTTEKLLINAMPYGKDFLFLEQILEINEHEISGTYRFKENEKIYNNHFINYPVTPGVLLLETLIQIGLVCFGIYLLNLYKSHKVFFPYVSYVESDFLNPVFPGDQVKVKSQKIYLRDNILKCKSAMYNLRDEMVVTQIGICTFKFQNP